MVALSPSIQTTSTRPLETSSPSGRLKSVAFRGQDRVTFSGLQQTVSNRAKKAGLSVFQAFKQVATLANTHPDARVIKGIGLKYGIPPAVTALMFAIPGGVLLYPILGIPITNKLANRGEAIIAAETASQDPKVRSIAKRLANIANGLLDPSADNGDAKQVIADYNHVKNELLDRAAKDTRTTKAVGGASALEKLRKFLHLTEGKFGYNLVGKLVNARKIYKTTIFGRTMRKLMQVGARWKFLMPLSILANGAFVALKWKKIRI